MNEKYTAKHSAGYSRKSILMLALLAAAALVLVILAIVVFTSDAPEEPEALPEVTEEAAAAAPEVSGTLERPEEPALPEEPVITYSNFEPHAAQSTEPSAHITETAVQVGEETVENYSASDVITFGLPDDYAKIDGLLTFRGDNFRSGSSVGFAEDMETKTFGESWSSPVSTLVAPDGNVWTGCGWTGQPLIVNWPKETRAIMNMYDWAKEAEELVEVIYPTMDGHIYFMELETGEPTRETLDMGYTFKGAGSIDPRGYPVLYVGAGYRSMNGEGRVFAISLIDFEILFTFGNADEFELRDWPCFDAAPLVDSETDQLIYAGENGILYIVKLNSNYDEAAGTLTMSPEFTRWRYNTDRANLFSYWLGMEASPVIWQGHLIMPDNGGFLMCLDLETLTLDWVLDILDDTNASPVLEIEDGHPYIYIAPSFHLGWQSFNTLDVPFYKIDAETGEIVWQISYECYSEEGVSGGVQGTCAVGKYNLADYVFVPYARAEAPEGGILAAVNKKTGEIAWECRTNSYTWCSPTIVYDANGDGYLLFSTLLGTLCLVDGQTGEILDSFDLQSHAEATIAAYGSNIIVGTRTNCIYGIKLQ